MIPVYSDLIYQDSQGIDSRVVYAVDLSNTGDVIIGNLNNSINNPTLADVKGKKISVEGINSFSHLFVLKALEKVGLGEGDVEIATVPVQNVKRELEKGTIVAGHIYQPYTTEALKKGYKILFAAWNNSRSYNGCACIPLRYYSSTTTRDSGYSKIDHRGTNLLREQ